MDTGQILSNYTYLILLIVIRYVGLFLVAPLFGSRVFPMRIKLGFIFFLTVITLPLLDQIISPSVPVKPLLILIDLVREMGVGLILGFIAFLPFAAIQLAGQFIDLRMGFAMANVVDPLHGTNAPIIGQFKNILATLLFLGINGHHLLLNGLYKSFELVLPGAGSLSGAGLQYLFRITGDLFILAFKIAIPVIATLFIADVIFGFLARSIPQMNIFIVGLPMKILVGFTVLMFSTHFMVYYFQDILLNIYKQMIQFLKLLT